LRRGPCHTPQERDAVEVLGRHTGVRERGRGRLDRELPGGQAGTPPGGRVAHADCGDPVVALHRFSSFDAETGVPTGAGRNSGRTSSGPTCRKTTWTSMPVRRASGGQSTMLVVIRSPACSTSSTTATLYGTRSL